MADSSSSARMNAVVTGKNEFSTFGGVFTPAILTILGVIMFMRSNFVISEAGIIGAVIILVIAKSITLMTSLSIGAICTNMQVRGGGAYYLISRVLGPEFGGAIGIALFLAQALSVPFYILGFTEALVRSSPGLAPHFQTIALIAAIILFIISYASASLAIRAQYIIMGFLVLSIIAFFGGALELFSFDTLNANMQPHYTALENAKEGATYSFWIIFAIYFPAVTGIAAGVNMSGDLKDPSRSIPKGTLYAVGVGFLIYLLQIFVCGGAFSREALREAPYDILHDNALFGLSFFVAAGVYAATLSSALGSYLGAPRVLQAVSRDRILNALKFFAKGTPKGDEPRRAMALTFVITIAVLLWAGNKAEGGALNAVAAIITMFFLYTYGMINMAAFTEAFGGNPSFRPRFRFFHWSTALFGAVGCIAVAMLINWLAATAAVLLIFGLMQYLNARHLQAAFGDARRGFFYNAARKHLLRLSTMSEDGKNWRPTILVLSGNPSSREELVSYAIWLESGRGIVFLANILLGKFSEYAPRRDAAIRQLSQFCAEKNIQAFPVVAVSEDLNQGMSMLLQTASVGPIRPNLAAFGWNTNPEKLDGYISQLRTASQLGMSIVLMRGAGLPRRGAKGRIDVWWRGHKNGGLMMILSHLLNSNWEWSRTEVRILRVVENEAGRAPAQKSLNELVEKARFDCQAQIIVSDRPYCEILHRHSGDAACVFLGFEIPEAEHAKQWQQTYNNFLEDMPTTIMVNSKGEEDMLA